MTLLQPQTIQNIQERAARISGLSTDYIRDTPVIEINQRFNNPTPESHTYLIATGNALRSHTISREKVEKNVTEALTEIDDLLKKHKT